jgi:hypothetical protein
MQKYFFIALFLVSTIGFIPAYRKFKLYIRGRIFLLLLAGIMIFGICVILLSMNVSLYESGYGKAKDLLIGFLTFEHGPEYRFIGSALFFSYLCIIWTLIAAVTNRILKSEKFNRK